MNNPRWRVGLKLGRTIYRDDELVGMMDDADMAKTMVKVLNAEYGKSLETYQQSERDEPTSNPWADLETALDLLIERNNGGSDKDVTTALNLLFTVRDRLRAEYVNKHSYEKEIK